MKAAKTRTKNRKRAREQSATVSCGLPLGLWAQAKAFVRQVGICGIFSDANGTMSCLMERGRPARAQTGRAGLG